MKHSPLLGRLGLLIVDEDQKLMTSTSYLMANKPNRDRYGGYWGSSDESSTANYYSGLNEEREVNLKVHTTALGLESFWMEKLAELTGGAYNPLSSDAIGEAG